MRYNIFLLLDVGTFSALVELLNMEMEYVLNYVYEESLNYLTIFPQNILLCESQRHIWFIKHVSKNVVYYKIRLWLSQTTVRKNNCWMALQGCRSMHFSGWRHLTSILSLSVTAQLVVVLSENQPSPLLTAQISECCSISCTWWWKRYNRMTQLTSLNGKSSGKLSEQN